MSERSRAGGLPAAAAAMNFCSSEVAVGDSTETTLIPGFSCSNFFETTSCMVLASFVQVVL